MPIYDYLCKKCGHTVELIVKDYMADIKCEKCNKSMERQVSNAYFRLYGDGVHRPNKK